MWYTDDKMAVKIMYEDPGKRGHKLCNFTTYVVKSLSTTNMKVIAKHRVPDPLYIHV